MAFTNTRTGNRFIVIAPAPTQMEFMTGSAQVENEYDLKIKLVDIEFETYHGRINPECGELKNAAVSVDLGYGSPIHAKVTGTYNGAGSELWLTM